jgi:hypothetical protein
MRKTFLGYYRPTDGEFRRLWDKCLFVLDANVLLNLYRYSEETRKRLIDILQRIEDRLWVPHQAALEYQRNRLEVISAQREAYTQIEHLLVDTQKKLDNQLKSYKRHPLINATKLFGSINDAFIGQIDELREIRQKHPDLVDRDDVREILTKLLAGKVGLPYSEERLKEICKEGEDRYAKSRPPGYKDAKSKEGERVFGDLVLWYQVIDKASAEKVPVIIVTDDVKEDWWWRHEGRIIGPNPELVEEVRNKANVGFYMYVSDKFMEYARDYLKQNVDQTAIDEIREVRRLDEQRRFYRERVLMQHEKQRNELRHELLALDSELVRLHAEAGVLNQQLDVLRAEPADVRQAADRLELAATLSLRIGEVEGRRHALDGRRHELNERLRFGLEERNSALHGNAGVRVVKMADGTRRILRRGFRPSSARAIEPLPETTGQEAGLKFDDKESS